MNRSVVSHTSARERPSSVLFLVATAILLAVLFASFAQPAFAQTPTPTPTTAPEATPVAAPTAEEVKALTESVLGYAALAIFLVLLYAGIAAALYYNSATTLGAKGISTKPVLLPSTVSTLETVAAVEGQPVIEAGPAAVTVGVPSEEFRATVPDGKASPDDAVWSVEPADVAGVMPSKGAKVKVIAAKAGAFKIKAEIGGKSSEPRDVVALAPSSNTVELPFIGKGWGTIVLSIVLVAAALLFGLLGVKEAVVWTFLTALLGFIFGVKMATRSDDPNGG